MTGAVLCGLSVLPELAAQEGGGTSIAAAIGSSVVKAFGNQVAQYAFGSLLSAIGINTDSSQSQAILNQLNQIESQLNAISEEINGIRTEIEMGFAQVEYSQAVSLIVPLIAQTKLFTDSFKDLVALNPTPADTPEQRAEKIEEITTLKGKILALFDCGGGSYQAGLDTWNSAMTGVGQSSLSLIKTWSKLVYLKAKGYYGPKQAHQMQRLWDFYDAQQALMAAYIIDYYKGSGAPIRAQTTLNDWYKYRAQQLALLRGQEAYEDIFPHSVENGNMVLQLTTVLPHALPQNTIVLKPANDVLNDWSAPMWPFKFYGQRTVDYLVMDKQAFISSTVKDTRTATWANKTFRTGWQQPSNQAIVALAGVIGADIAAEDDHVDHFVNAFRSKGFSFVPSNNQPVINPVAICSGDGTNEGAIPEFRGGIYNDIYIEGKNWMHDPQSVFSRREYMRLQPFLLLVRGTFPKSQGEYYWWGFD